MYGLIGRMLATAGRREELLAILLDNNEPMPGCRSYIVARDPASEDGIWITEVWDSQAEHQGSLQLPHVQAMIAKAPDNCRLRRAVRNRAAGWDGALA
jgi:quinol monooxygenase YgiN